MTRLTHYGWTLSLCLVSLACSSTPVEKPTARFQSAAIRGATAQGFTVDFDVELSNPNSFTVPLAGADYALALGGVEVLSDEVKPKESIPARGTTSVMLPVTVSFQSLLAAEQAIRQSGGDVPFAFSGDLEFGGSDNPLPLLGSAGRVRVPFNYRGTLPLRQVLSDPAVLLRSEAARRLAGRALESILTR